MRRTTVEVRRVGTRTGWGRELAVEGPWTADCTARFWGEGCDSISWRPPKARKRATCDHLVAFRAHLRRLHVIAATQMDDSALAEMDELEDLHALTRAKNPLDLSSLTRLRTLSLDDRPGLDGFAHASLESAYFASSERRLADLAAATGLITLKLGGSATQSVDLRARLPDLTHLMVQTSRVESLVGLDAPRLESLNLDGAASDHVLDLAPLAELSSLRWVVIGGPGAVRNSHLIREREGIELRLSRAIEVES